MRGLNQTFAKKKRGKKMSKRIISKLVKIVKIKTVCMDCDTVIEDGPNGRVSHGICKPCLIKRTGLTKEELDTMGSN
jgi:hypothetical protein